MASLDKVLYTARTHTTGGRDGASRSDDGRLAGRNAAAWPDVRALPRRASMAVVFSDPPRILLLIFLAYAVSGPLQYLLRLRRTRSI